MGMLRHRGNIALIGFMAAGKTTVGVALADMLRYTFIDTDELITGRAGRSVAEIFATEGEAGFRQRERSCVEKLRDWQQLVISCGGGLARDPHNVTLLQSYSTIVWLRVTPYEAARRLLRDATPRPLIDGYVTERSHAAVMARVEELLTERTPFYEAAADLVVDVDGRLPEVIARQIARGESDHGR